MSWFRYLKNIPSTDYYSPPVKRKIKKINPSDDIAEGTWLYVNVADLNIDKKLDNDLSYVSDSNSYIVVYENEVLEDSYKPVKTQIIGDKLFFAAAENHPRNQIINNTYIVYYMANGIKGLSSNVSNGITSYYLDPSESSETYVNVESIEELEYTVEPGSNSYYNFSFINPGSDWRYASSSTVGATFYITFSGPTLSIKGYRGPDAGKIYISVTPIDREASTSDNKSYTVDCYSQVSEDNVEIFRASNLKSQDYKASVSILSSSNIKSSGNYISVNSYSFNYNGYFTIGEELLKNDIRTLSLGATTASSSIVGGSVDVVYQNVAGGGVNISDAPPSSSSNGDFWYESDTGKLYIFYDNQWISVGSSGGASALSYLSGVRNALVTMWMEAS